MKKRSHGFTLMELMVTLALAAMIFAIGAPSFNNFRRNNRLTGIANDFLGAIQVARGEAIKQQTTVAVCPSDNATSATPTCTTGPYRGWLVFVDNKTNNCTLDAGETVLRVEGRVDTESASPLYIKSSGACISFAATGFRQTKSDTGVDVADHTLFCDDRGLAQQGGTRPDPLDPAKRLQSAGRGVEVTATGRARVTRTLSDIEKWALDCK